MRAIVLLALALAACSSDSLPGGDGAMSAQDMMGDLSPRDLANVPRTCNDVSECRRFSSYCDPPGCVCLSLSKNEPDPVCESSNMITCFVDPCQVDNRMLRCDNRVCLLL